MRPHFTTHLSAVELARYDLRKGSEVLGGTVIARSASKLRDHFEQFGACGFVHITLSAPEGVWLDRATWLASMRGDGLLPELGVSARELLGRLSAE